MRTFTQNPEETLLKRSGLSANFKSHITADPYEREADSVANRVMRMPVVGPQTNCVCGGGCPHCKKERSGRMQAGGRPLAAATRQFMEPRLGADFGNVRIHSDDAAVASAARIQARAYTVGSHITLGKGESEGDRPLMAHELTHVMQQRAADGSVPTIQRQASGRSEPAPEAEAAVGHARSMLSAGNILFDSWGNDLRDNDNDGIMDWEGSDDDETEPEDGTHYRGTYTDFGLIAGTYVRGWRDEFGVAHSNVTVPTTRTVSGTFKYRVCADVVSQAYAEAGLMSHQRSTRRIIHQFREIGTIWHGRSNFPDEYLPGDFVATYAGHGGHSGIVTTRSPTTSAPTVIELPGPSTQADAGTYDPASTNDVKEQIWSKRGVVDEHQYLGRYTGRRH